MVPPLPLAPLRGHPGRLLEESTDLFEAKPRSSADLPRSALSGDAKGLFTVLSREPYVTDFLSGLSSTRNEDCVEAAGASCSRSRTLPEDLRRPKFLRFNPFGM